MTHDVSRLAAGRLWRSRGGGDAMQMRPSFGRLCAEQFLDGTDVVQTRQEAVTPGLLRVETVSVKTISRS